MARRAIAQSCELGLTWPLSPAAPLALVSWEALCRCQAPQPLDSNLFAPRMQTGMCTAIGDTCQARASTLVVSSSPSLCSCSESFDVGSCREVVVFLGWREGHFSPTIGYRGSTQHVCTSHSACRGVSFLGGWACCPSASAKPWAAHKGFVLFLDCKRRDWCLKAHSLILRE